MLLIVAIGTQQCKVFYNVMFRVPIFVVNVQNFFFAVTTPFAPTTSQSKKTNFPLPHRLDFVQQTRLFTLVADASPVSIRATSTTSLFVVPDQDGFATNNTWMFFATGKPVTSWAAIRFPLASLYLAWALIDLLSTDHAGCIWMSFILTHLASIPLIHACGALSWIPDPVRLSLRA